MDQAVLVSSGQALVRALDAAGLAPQIAMWVHNSETDTWKLWIVPPDTVTDKHDFYRRVAKAISAHRNVLGDFAASDVEMVPISHPAMQGIGTFMRLEGLGSVHFSGNRFDGFYLPDGIILRSVLERRASVWA